MKCLQGLKMFTRLYIVLWTVYKEDYIDLRTKQIWLKNIYKAIYSLVKCLHTKQIWFENVYKANIVKW